MHLHNDAGTALILIEPLVHGQHREFDEIRCRSLHRCIDRGTLCRLPARVVAGADIGEEKTAAENGFHKAVLTHLGSYLVHEGTDTRIPLKIKIDIFLRLTALNPQLAGKAKRRHAVNQSEIDGLGTAALVTRDLLDRCAEDFRSSGAVHVLTSFKGAQQACIDRQVCHDPQFDLGVIRPTS